ncbi:MAG: metallophosphoesterase [Anaerolineae bacterium]|nr:metallophosphoesterase [Anaerolineae bacterium]
MDKHYLRGKMQSAQTRLMQRLGRQRFAADQFEIVSLPVRISGLDPAFTGYRLVQVSDIHLGNWVTAERWQGIVRLINAQEPDTIALTGDFISYVLDGVLDDLAAGLSRLQARDVILAVMGNHDHWMDVGRVRQTLAASGVMELQNSVYTLRRDTAVLHIAGVDNITVKADDLPTVLAALPPDGPAILLAHEPDFAETSAATGRFALQLSGHSHGGQVVLPRVGPMRGPLFKQYPNGRYQVGQMVQYTNRGVGTNAIRLRYRCKPEITVITLYP